jgi:hypothetical protein
MHKSKHPTGGVGALLLHPPLLQEAHDQLVVGAPHKLGVPESDPHIANIVVYFTAFKFGSFLLNYKIWIKIIL